jgi:hypothetical protein
VRRAGKRKTLYDILHIRIPKELRELLKQASKDNDRSFAGQVKHYLTIGLRKDGYLPRS